MQIFLVLVSWSCFAPSGPAQAQEIDEPFDGLSLDTLTLYPETLDAPPEIPSPARTSDGVEILTVCLKDNKYALLPVTVENGSPLLYSRRIKSLYGKDRQLDVDSGDFPTLARTGLHSHRELDGTKMITGVRVPVITYIGRPGRFSEAGFMAADEEIITVLKNDNRLVKKLDLTHPQLARPLFHVWNILLSEIKLGKWGRHWDNIESFDYRGRKVFLEARGTKGWQVSIFQDEIQGRFDIAIRTELSRAEKDFLKTSYSHLSPQQLEELEEKISLIQFSEMAPYYIMRYGFYEGHTAYRTDPIAIAFLFGLKPLEEIENSFPGELKRILFSHFTDEQPDLGG